jgi:ABC-type multidrug transport system ATPase subunit
MLLGLVTPNAGRPPSAASFYRDLPNPTGTVGAVLEATSFHPARRARTHLRMVARAGGHDEARADVVLDLVGLAADAKRKVGGFSMGMRQRLELASALIGDPDVLILDEPSNGLDPQGIAWLRDFMRYLAGEGAPSWCRRTCWPKWPRPSTTPSSCRTASSRRRGRWSRSRRVSPRRPCTRARPRPIGCAPC